MQPSTDEHQVQTSLTKPSQNQKHVKKDETCDPADLQPVHIY